MNHPNAYRRWAEALLELEQDRPRVFKASRVCDFDYPWSGDMWGTHAGTGSERALYCYLIAEFLERENG